MKIIKTDNFARETISDCLIAEKVPAFYADKIVEDLNKRFSGNSSPDYFKAVEDNYKLYYFDP